MTGPWAALSLWRRRMGTRNCVVVDGLGMARITQLVSVGADASEPGRRLMVAPPVRVQTRVAASVKLVVPGSWSAKAGLATAAPPMEAMSWALMIPWPGPVRKPLHRRLAVELKIDV